MVLEMSGKFGLTPADRNKLLRDGAMRFDDETLFDRVLQTQQPANGAAEAPTPQPAPGHDAAAIGSLTAFDSVPPGAKPN